MRGEYSAAIQRLGAVLNDDFFQDEALFMLGHCFLATGMNGIGAVITSAAIDARAARGSGKAFPEAMINLGGAYKAERRNAMADKIWHEALELETVPSERAKILCNLSTLYVGEGQPEKGIEYCDAALREDPGNHGAYANRGIACLTLGRWREGWEGVRHTYASGDRERRNYGDLPEWDGSLGKHVIVWGDQGLGDEIFYAACLGDLQKMSRKVTLDCHPRLPALFARSFPEIAVHGTRKDLSALPWLQNCDADAHVALADLPGFLRNEGEWDGLPYLKADWQKTLAGTMRREDGIAPLRIGLSWTGGSKKTRVELRSMPLAMLEPIVRARPDAEWFSLQYTPTAAREVCEFEEKTGIRIAHFPGQVECFDYDRTASFVAGLDLVITVTTAVHDLAGALGVPNWVLVPSRPPWRFQMTGETLPWYGSSKLYRQERDGEWAHPIARIAGDLEGWRRSFSELHGRSP